MPETTNKTSTPPPNTEAALQAEGAARQHGEPNANPAKNATHVVTKKALSVHVDGVDYVTGSEIDARALPDHILDHYEEEGYIKPLSSRKASS